MRNLRRYFFGFLVVLFLFASRLSHAEEPATVYLKNGNVVECVILSESDTSVVVFWEGGEVTFNKNEISNIKRASDSSAGHQEATIYLKNKNIMQATILREDEHVVVASWNGIEVTLTREEIETIEYGDGKAVPTGDGIVLAKTDENTPWPYKSDRVIRLNNGQVLDGKIIESNPYAVMFQDDLGSGSYSELEVARDRIDSLLFRPVVDEGSLKIAEWIRAQFPKMKFYTTGMITLVTDTQGVSLKEIKRALAEQATALYLEFFDLLKDKKPAAQHYVVIFDKQEEYAAYALKDGIPVSVCQGYFMPAKKILFMSNAFGDQATDLLYQTVSQSRGKVDKEIQQAKDLYGAEHSTQLDNKAREAKERLDSAVIYMSGLSRDFALVLLRHEFTHEFFYNWGIQGIRVSNIKDSAGGGKEKEDPAPAKGENGEDAKTRIMGLLGIEKPGQKARVIPVEAANSWFVEGLAEYAATTMINEPNNERLYNLKESKKKNEIWPLEQLTVYKMGSFPGVTEEAALSAYAQSWGFVGFLMKYYREGFLSFLGRLTRQIPKDGEDIAWLTESVGRDLKTLQAEWLTFIDSLDTVADPRVEKKIRVYEILNLK